MDPDKIKLPAMSNQKEYGQVSAECRPQATSAAIRRRKTFYQGPAIILLALYEQYSDAEHAS